MAPYSSGLDAFPSLLVTDRCTVLLTLTATACPTRLAAASIPRRRRELVRFILIVCAGDSSYEIVIEKAAQSTENKMTEW